MYEDIKPAEGVRLGLVYEMARRSMTGADLARRLGTNMTSVSAWSNGISAPSAEQLASMCEMFGCEPRYLLHREGMEDQ